MKVRVALPIKDIRFNYWCSPPAIKDRIIPVKHLIIWKLTTYHHISNAKRIRAEHFDRVTS